MSGRRRVPVVVWHFPGGREVRESLAQYRERLEGFAARCVVSDDAHARAEGRRIQRENAALAAAGELAVLQAAARSRAGGNERRERVREDNAARNDKIRDAYAALTVAPRFRCAVLAARFPALSVRQIRRIINAK